MHTHGINRTLLNPRELQSTQESNFLEMAILNSVSASVTQGTIWKIQN